MVGRASPKRKLLRVRLARSERSVRKLWTGWPSSVRLVMALRRAAGETFGLGDGGCALSGGGFKIVVLEQHRGEVSLHAPRGVVGQHAQEAWARTQWAAWWIGRTSRSPDLMSRKPRSAWLQAFIGEDEGGGGEAVSGKRASDHIYAVEGGLGGDRLGLARPCRGRLGDGEVEMLGHVATVDDGADLEGDLVLAAERVALLLGHRADLDQRRLGQLEEFVALASALGGELRVAADDEALARIVGPKRSPPCRARRTARAARGRPRPRAP